MKSIICIVGATNTGKSKIALNLARGIGEIISVDSTQIYKQINIGTGKITKAKMGDIPHHLIDIVSLEDEYNSYNFLNDAYKKSNYIISKGKIPFLVGGTGLYFKLINDGIFQTNYKNSNIKEVRNNLIKELNILGRYGLYQKLEKVNKEYAKTFHPNNYTKTLRALEIYELKKYNIQDLWQKDIFHPFKHFNIIKIGIKCNRNILYKNINKRCNLMISNGLIDETRKVLNNKTVNKLMKIIGYKHIIKYLNKEISYNDAIETFKRDTRRYAKRQITFFKRIPNIKWFNIEDIAEIEKYIDKCKNKL